MCHTYATRENGRDVTRLPRPSLSSPRLLLYQKLRESQASWPHGFISQELLETFKPTLE